MVKLQHVDQIQACLQTENCDETIFMLNLTLKYTRLQE